MHTLTFWHTYTHTANARRAKAVTLIITLSQPKWGCEAELISTWTLCEGEKKSLIKSLQHFDSLTFFFFFFRSCVTEFLCHCWLQSGHPPPFTTWPETSVTNRINHSFLKTNCYPEKTLNSFLSFTKLWLKYRCRHTGKESKEGCETFFFSWVFTFFMQMHSIPHPNLSTNEKKTVASGWVDLSRPLKWHFSTLWCMIWLLSHIYDISLSWKSMGLNGEVVSDINHPSLSYLPLCVTLDVKRSTDSANGGYKREEKKKGIWVDCDKDNICTKRERSERRDGRR